MKLIVSPAGLLLDLDQVQRNPYPRCPVSGAPLSEEGIAVTQYPSDSARKTAKDDLAKMEADGQAVAAAIAAVAQAAAESALSARLASLETRLGATEALITAAAPAPPASPV